MAIELSLKDFQKVAHGKYNLGELTLKKGKLDYVNNHMHALKGLNTKVVDPRTTVEIKEAFLNALHEAGLGMFEVAQLRRELGLATQEGERVDQYAVKPLTREQTRQILQRYDRVVRSATGVSEQRLEYGAKAERRQLAKDAYEAMLQHRSAARLEALRPLLVARTQGELFAALPGSVQKALKGASDELKRDVSKIFTVMVYAYGETMDVEAMAALAMKKALIAQYAQRLDVEKVQTAYFASFVNGLPASAGADTILKDVQEALKKDRVLTGGERAPNVGKMLTREEVHPLEIVRYDAYVSYLDKMASVYGGVQALSEDILIDFFATFDKVKFDTHVLPEGALGKLREDVDGVLETCPNEVEWIDEQHKDGVEIETYLSSEMKRLKAKPEVIEKRMTALMKELTEVKDAGGNAVKEQALTMQMNLERSTLDRLPKLLKETETKLRVATYVNQATQLYSKGVDHYQRDAMASEHLNYRLIGALVNDSSAPLVVNGRVLERKGIKAMVNEGLDHVREHARKIGSDDDAPRQLEACLNEDAIKAQVEKASSEVNAFVEALALKDNTKVEFVAQLLYVAIASLKDQINAAFSETKMNDPNLLLQYVKDAPIVVNVDVEKQTVDVSMEVGVVHSGDHEGAYEFEVGRFNFVQAFSLQGLGDDTVQKPTIVSARVAQTFDVK